MWRYIQSDVLYTEVFQLGAMVYWPFNIICEKSVTDILTFSKIIAFTSNVVGAADEVEDCTADYSLEEALFNKRRWSFKVSLHLSHSLDVNVSHLLFILVALGTFTMS